VSAKPFTLSEKDVERQCDSLMAQLGWVAIRFSQARASHQTEGIPDRRYYHAGRRLALWFEAKAPNGRQRPAQKQFQKMCESCGEVYVLGGVDELAAALRSVTAHPHQEPAEA